MKEIWKSLSIRHKITSLIVLTIMLVTITIIPAISYLIKDALLKQQKNHLESVKNLVIKLFEDYQSKVTNYTKLFSNDREIKDSLFYHTELAGEREHPLRAVTRLHKSFDVSSIEVGDARGNIVAIAEDPDKFDNDRSADPLIKNALRGKVTSGIVLMEQGFLIKASAPIYYNESQIIGTITSGILLDDILLSKIKELSNTDLVIIDNADHAISSTLKKAVNSDAQQNLNAPTGRNNGKNLVITFPLIDVANNVIGNVMILQEDRLPMIIAKTHLTLLILLLTISVLSIFVVFVTLRRLMQPVIRLKEGAERIGKGDFGYRIDVTSRDEIGELSEGFNKMAQNLENLQIMEERLSQAERLAAVGKFAAGIAHEINNPVGNVIGIAKLMLKNIKDENTKEDIESIIKDANRCARITKDLLAYSRQSPPQKELTALDALIDDAIKTVMDQANSKQIEIIREADPGLQDIYVDPLQMSQVLSNILLNAVQSIESSGEIIVRTSLIGDHSPSPPPTREGGNERNDLLQGEGAKGCVIEISISDNGIGIEDEIKDKIFYPFFTTKSVGEGTGLGLAISYGIIQNHEGEIVVESRKGHGSTFRIRLPAEEVHGQTC
ncbi:MAG: ATP-binding protein [Nitrospirota bacterium]